jgi:hypothetical protein
MSYILNALKKAENKSFTSDSIKIKKQVLVLKQQTTRKKLKLLSLMALLLIALLGGWLLGQIQNPQQDSITEFEDHRRLSDRKKTTPLNKESSLEKNTLVDSSKREVEKFPNDGLRSGGDKGNQKVEVKDFNPPIPVRVIAKPINRETPKETPVVQKAASTITTVKPLQNYLDLPFLLRQNMPQLKISLHFYSFNPARRIVRINGKILHENDRIEDGLTVEEIKTASAVIGYNGTLFELNAPGG